MGKRAQAKRDKKEIAEKEHKQLVQRLESSKNPWIRFWRRFDFWVYTFCFIALVAFPFIRKDVFNGISYATIHTSKGDIELQLYGNDAPKTVDNFKKLSTGGYYNNLIWHRVIKGFMIQSGDPKGDGTGGESADGGTFADEINADYLGLDKEIVGQTAAVYGQLSSDDKTKFATSTVKAYYESKGYKYSTTLKSHKLEAGSLAMANYGPDTNGSQFFIVTEQAQPHLDGQHTVFGKVTKGLDVVKEISEVAVDENDKPNDPVLVKSIEIKE